MTLVVTSLPLARAFTCFSICVYIRTCFRFALIGGNLTAQSTGSHRGIGGGIQIFQRRSCKLSFLFPPRRQRAPESLLAGLEYLMTLPAQRKRLIKTNNTCPCKSNCAFLWRNVVAVPSRTNRHCDGSWFPCGLHHLYYPLCFFAILKELRGEGREAIKTGHRNTQRPER